MIRTPTYVACVPNRGSPPAYLLHEGYREEVAKHFTLTITDDHFAFARNGESIEAESRLGGVYAIRTNVAADELAASEVAQAYKGLILAEPAFRSYKTVDLEVRPIHHRLPDRVPVHSFQSPLAELATFTRTPWRSPTASTTPSRSTRSRPNRRPPPSICSASRHGCRKENSAAMT
ncbi:MAG: hypothetical protein JOY71_14650 [Acetobacteraceae bacterium]|nr:hypothetical protein [Acetobacteraceae bacterium]MBV8591175.1 hypothetical protein [Acetobacteraceae bacterium]